MKRKFAFHFAITVLLAIFATGCCTQSLIDKTHKETHDVFYPTAIFQSTNGNSFALEGSFHKKQLSTNYYTNGDLWLTEIKKLPSYSATNSILENNLVDYKKLADLPDNKVGLETKRHHPNMGLLVFTPVTVAVDVATSPFQLLGMLLIGWAMANSHGC
jgi:hypothetical protein